MGHPVARVPRNVPPYFFVGVLALLTLGLVPLAGCGTAAHSVRLDTGQGKPLVVTARIGEQPVQLREGEFKASLAELARDVRPASNPLQHARRLMSGSPWHQEVYLKWTGRRLEVDAEAQAVPRAAREGLEMTGAYGRWCERQGRPWDCLLLLKEGSVLNAEGRYALAMELALGAVLDEAMQALKDMASPQEVRATLVSAMALYMALWAIPEPAIFQGDGGHVDGQPHRLPGRGHGVEPHAGLEAVGGGGGPGHHLRPVVRGGVAFWTGDFGF
jgi:hypothetical protein